MNKNICNRVYTLFTIGIFLILANSCTKVDDINKPISVGTVTDIDGNIYHTVKIGTQEWMVENLKTTKYNNGDPITNITDGTIWSGTKTAAYCNYNNDVFYSETYGRLYNWYAVGDSRKIAPVGWHVPTKVEWMTLLIFIDGKLGKLQEKGCAHWSAPNSEATNETGFTALPGGQRVIDLFGSSGFGSAGEYGYWWTSSTESNVVLDRWSSDHDATRTAIVIVNYGRPQYQDYFLKCYGMSVRCIKD